jgi:glutamyl-tRNA synthetase
LRALPEGELVARVIPYLQGADLRLETVTPEQHEILLAAAPLIQERMTTLSEAVDLLTFLFVPEHSFTVDEVDAAKALDDNGRKAVNAAEAALSGLSEWNTAAIEAALRAALVDGLGLKPRDAFGPVRVAVTGRRISPPLFESLELLGRERTLSRLAGAGGR